MYCVFKYQHGIYLLFFVLSSICISVIGQFSWRKEHKAIQLINKETKPIYDNGRERLHTLHL